MIIARRKGVVVVESIYAAAAASRGEHVAEVCGYICVLLLRRPAAAAGATATLPKTISSATDPQHPRPPVRPNDCQSRDHGTHMFFIRFVFFFISPFNFFLFQEKLRTLSFSDDVNEKFSIESRQNRPLLLT